MVYEGLDEKYHAALLDAKTKEPIGEEEQFNTLEELIGFLHRLEGDDASPKTLFLCLMMLRNGPFERVMYRKPLEEKVRQILRLTPSNQFSKLFWKGCSKE